MTKTLLSLTQVKRRLKKCEVVKLSDLPVDRDYLSDNDDFESRSVETCYDPNNSSFIMGSPSVTNPTPPPAGVVADGGVVSSNQGVGGNPSYSGKVRKSAANFSDFISGELTNNPNQQNSRAFHDHNQLENRKQGDFNKRRLKRAEVKTLLQRRNMDEFSENEGESSFKSWSPSVLQSSPMTSSNPNQLKKVKTELKQDTSKEPIPMQQKRSFASLPNSLDVSEESDMDQGKSKEADTLSSKVQPKRSSPPTRVTTALETDFEKEKMTPLISSPRTVETDHNQLSTKEALPPPNIKPLSPSNKQQDCFTTISNNLLSLQQQQLSPGGSKCCTQTQLLERNGLEEKPDINSHKQQDGANSSTYSTVDLETPVQQPSTSSTVADQIEGNSNAQSLEWTR